VRRRARGRAAAVLAAALLAGALAGGCTRFKRFAYEGVGRDAWQKPDEVVAALELRPGDRVADLGAGGGYFTFRLAEAVGPEGRVLAVDVDDGLLAYLAERAREEGRTNVEPVRAAYDDARIPAPGADLVFTCNTYHHLEDRSAYFARLRSSLRPGGRVAIVDFTPGRAPFGAHGTDPDTIVRELGDAGYALVARHDFLETQSFLVFAPREETGGAARPAPGDVR